MKKIIGILLLFTFFSCQNNSEKKENNSNNSEKINPNLPQFSKLNSSESGVLFNNILNETEDLNYFNFPNLYMGGGVAVGDFNNDNLPDLFFVGAMVANKLYLNKGNLKFEDISQKAGIEAKTGIKTGVSLVDINADGFLDIYVCRTGIGALEERANLLFINNQDLTFTESAKAYGLDCMANSNHANFFDFDLDGDLDVYIMNYPADNKKSIQIRGKRIKNNFERITIPETKYESDRLYKNNGDGTFVNISNEAGINNCGFGLSCTVSDFNADGLPDIYVANDYIEPSYLYLNNGNGAFSENYEQFFRHTSHNAMGVDIADFNNDGLMDLIELDMLAEGNKRQKLLMNSMQLKRYETLVRCKYGHQFGRNCLQLNNGNGTFSEVGCLAGISNTDWSWCPLFADFDNDGKNDLFISNGFRRDFTDLDFIKFMSDSLPKQNINYVDVLNKIPVTKIQNYIYQNQGNLKFKNVSNNWGFTDLTFSTGTVYSDLDNDGDLEIIINNIEDQALIYKNNTTQKSENNYLKIILNGSKRNKFGIGAKVIVETSQGKKVRELNPIRGFLSSSEPILHFGLGNEKKIQEIKIVWQDGKEQILKSINLNRLITLNYNEAIKLNNKEEIKQKTTFSEITNELEINFKHQENIFNDFNREKLLPRKLSQFGPNITVGDVNKDGLEDFFVGGAFGSAGAIFIQTKDSKFQKTNQLALNQDKDFEDVGCLFFDADGDSDLDLYVVSGGNKYAYKSRAYQDRLYKNDGKGNFQRAKNDLPEIFSSGSCVAANDFDKDGDLDLFVGGRVVPGKYPFPAQSYILQNNGKGKFVNPTAQIAPELPQAGMISSAIWADYNSDGFSDLIVVGEWMPIVIFQNHNGKLKSVISQTGLSNSYGFWNKILACDYDSDGDLDFIAGNLGNNSRLKASESAPLEIYIKDFDYNNKLDPIVCYYNNGKSYPLPQRDILIEQIPSLRKRFVQYEKYANAGIREIFSPEELKNAITLKCQNVQTCFVQNQGNGTFILQPLPIQAQISPCYGILFDDFNKDNSPDILIAGNDYGMEIETSRIDAGNGLLLSGNGSEFYNPIPLVKSGIAASKDTRDLAQIKLANGKKLILVANNDDYIQAFVQN